MTQTSRKWSHRLLVVALCISTTTVSHLFATGITEDPETVTQASVGDLLARAVPQPQLSRFANGYRVSSVGDLKIIEVIRPFPGATSEDTQIYVLYPRELDPPLIDGADQVIGVPVESVTSMSTTFLAHLEKVNQTELVTAVDSLDFVYSQRYRSRAGEIAEVGSGPGVDVEQLIVLDPDLIIVNSFGGEFDAAPTLKEAELPVVISGDWLENDPLGRAEWFVFTSLFVGQETVATGLMSEIAAEYERLSELGRSAADKPTVLINAPFQGTWSIAGGESYAARFIEDAGGSYVYSDDESTGALFFDLEAVFAEAGDAEIWINPGQWASLDQARAEDERYEEFRAFAQGALYNYNARMSANGAIDYFESGAINPDIVLADLISIFHPELLPGHELYYYQRLE